MLTHLFYIVGVWLALGLVIALLIGAHIRHTDFFTSLLYLGLLIFAGDYIVWWLGIPVRTIYYASIVTIAIGIPFIIIFRDWNAVGQAFFLFSIEASITYLIYAFLVTAFSPVSPIAFIISFLLLFLEIKSAREERWLVEKFPDYPDYQRRVPKHAVQAKTAVGKDPILRSRAEIEELRQKIEAAMVELHAALPAAVGKDRGSRYVEVRLRARLAHRPRRRGEAAGAQAHQHVFVAAVRYFHSLRPQRDNV